MVGADYAAVGAAAVTTRTGGGAAIGGNVDAGGDVTGRDDRQQNLNIQFAPTDASLKYPGVVFTIQEMFAKMDRKLEEHGEQLLEILAKVAAIEFRQGAIEKRFDDMEKGNHEANRQSERLQQAQSVMIYRIAVVLMIVGIIAMLEWLILHLAR